MQLKALAASTVLALSTVISSYAQATLNGCYVPQSGFAASNSIPPNGEEQIGTYRIVLVNDKAPLRDRRIVLSGPFKGKIVGGNPSNPVLDHVLGDLNLEGLILTKGDQASVTGGTSTTVEVTEDLNPVAGTGKFSGLIPGGKITVTGTLDLLTGINTFDVVPGEGQLCFPVIP